MPILETADGTRLDTAADAKATVNQKFAAAMTGDGQGDTSAPPKRPERPADPPKRRGRPPKSEQARTTTAAGPAGPVALDDAARANGVAGWVQIGAGLVLGAGRVTGNTAFNADAYVIASSAPQIADACVQVAKHDARFAAALDKVCSSGPYAALITVSFQVGMQCLRNHRPGLALPGTVHPDDLFPEVGDDAQAVGTAA